MAGMEKVKKTSNGCEKAKPIPRKGSSFREPSANIAAIDFGTTNCSVAYTIIGSSREEGTRILPLNTTYYRVPTAILFKKDGSILSFGYDARTQYLDLDDEDRLEHAYFEQIKMTLQHDEVYTSYATVLSTCSNSFLPSMLPTAECEQGEDNQSKKWEGVLPRGCDCTSPKVPEDRADREASSAWWAPPGSN